jgi:hypothetical protein
MFLINKIKIVIINPEIINKIKNNNIPNTIPIIENINIYKYNVS